MSGGRKYYRFDLSTARSGDLEKCMGRFIRVVRASSATANIKIAVGRNIDDHYEELTKNGSINVGEGFDRFYVRNDAQAGDWVILMINDGPGGYDVENTSLGNINSVGSIDDPVEIGAHGTINDTPDESVAATSTEEVLAANADRKEVTIGNPISNSAWIRVGGSATDSDTGTRLEPGQAWTRQYNGAVHVYNSHSSAQSVTIEEIE